MKKQTSTKKVTGKMKRRTKAFADTLLANPTMSQTEAYIQTHETNSRETARANASELLAKANVQIYMQEHVNRAKSRIVELVDSDKEQIALQASEAILNRELGKPIQRQETKTTNLNLNVEASEELNSSFAEFLKAQTQQS